MKIIPVIDLLDGLAVHARFGLRDQYKPVDTRLCRSPDPLRVVESFTGIYPFAVIYIADLDAIQHQGNNNDLIVALACRYPHTEFWIDAGETSPLRLANTPANLKTVIGSESISVADWQLLQKVSPDSYILSLDFRDSQLCGPELILSSASCWPETVITMFLDRVGSSRGPNLPILEEIISLSTRSAIIAAGGTRDIHDLELLQQRGCRGALIASILHDLRLGAEEIRCIERIL